ncbi:MAG: hypothetical protein ACR2NZ_19320 [Rubripirellula sp.]
MQSESMLPATWDVPQVFRDRIGSHVGRQRAMVADDHLLLVLHAPPKPDQDERRGRFFWLKPDGNWTSNQLGSGPAAMKKHLDEYDKQIEELEKMEEQAESSLAHFCVLENLAPLQRAIRNLHVALQDARKQRPDVRALIDMRDRAYDLERMAELLGAGTKNSLDFEIAKRSEEQAHASERMALSAHRLNLLAAFFFPLATLTAVFGMEIRSGLEGSPEPHTFFVVICLGLIMGAFLMWYVRMRKQA